ncbi:MAG: ABC transporter permease [Lachnospiraceae bacterium]
MTLPFQNDTRAIEKKIAKRSFQADKTRNIIAVIAIALTTILFTSLFTLGTGMTESTQRANMILSGGDGHARIVNMSQSDYDKISIHPLIQEIAYCRKLADSVDNQSLSKRDTQFWYYDEVGLQYNFVTPTGGHKPEAENEILTDTTTLEWLGIPQKAGTEFTLELTVHNQKVTRNFVLAGWWESYPGVQHGTIIASQAYMEAHADELTDTFNQDQVDTGTITGIIKFESTQSIEEELKTVVEDSGYSMDPASQNYINAAINPFYLSSVNSGGVGTQFALICALLLFLFTGYLIIYNIFQISILRDLHFYGLLKTIGTTGRQINSIIRRQAWTLSLIGVPIGLCGGFFIGKALLPILMAQTSFSGNGVTVSPNPLIFIAAALFALATVQISTRKPAKMAAKVSPIEAVRYTDSDVIAKQKKSPRPGNLQKGMARANLGRNKKRTVLVVLSLTLSIVLTNTVFNFSHSVDPEYAIQNLMNSDFTIGQSSLFDYYEVDEESALSASFIDAVEDQDGFESGGCEYGCTAVYKSETTRQMEDFNQPEEGDFSTHIYGLDALLFSQLELVDGGLDAEKLASGEYILEGAYVNSRGVMDEESLNHSVGDKVELSCNGNVREFTILGHVVANATNTYDWVGSCFFFSSDVYQEFTGNTYVMSYSFDVSHGKESEMDTFLKQYTSDEEPTMTYKSKSTIMAGTTDIQNIVVSVGGTLAFIIGLIGVLNFVNTILTSIFTRRRELAILQSIGMTGRQLMKMLCMEGCYYTVISAIISIPLCLVSTLMIVRPICEGIWFLDFKINLWPLLTLFLLMFLIGVLIPYVTYRILNRQSVIERLKNGE